MTATIGYTDQVRAFCQRHDATALIDRAIRLARELFPDVSGITTEVSHDPEEDSEWLIVRVSTQSTPARLAAAYQQYIEQWVQATPPEKRHLVRLSWCA